MRISSSVVVLILAAGCGTKKEPPAAGSGSARGSAGDQRPVPAGSAAGSVAQPRPAPPARPLPPLDADPGGATGKVAWVASLGGPKVDVARALAVTADDATLVAGDFEDTASFGDKQLTVVGKSDAYLARLDAKGAVEWVTQLGGKNQERGSEVAVDAKGNAVVAGLFSDKLTAGGLTAKAHDSDDLFVAGVDPKGEVQWLWTTGGDASDDCTAIAPAPDGGWIAAVSFSRSATFGDATLTSRGGDDAALVKLTAGGEVEWVTQVGGEYPDYIDQVALDPSGNIFVFGRFRHAIDLGGGVLNGEGDSDLFLARFDAAGNHVWSERIGNAFEEVAGGLAVDQAGNLAITGSYDKDLDFLGTPLLSKGEADVFIARVSSDGKLQWVKSYGAEREDIGQGIAVDKAGNVVATGWFETTIDFGGGEWKSRGYKDGWVVKLTAKGDYVWGRRFGDWDHDGGLAVAIGPDGSPRIAGLYRYKLDLIDKGPTAVQVAKTNLAKPDAFVARLAR